MARPDAALEDATSFLSRHALDATVRVRVRGRWRTFLARHGKGLLGGGIVGFVLMAALFASLLVPYDPVEQDIIARLRPPFWLQGGTSGHLLGTDGLGRDVLARLVYGARTSIAISVGAVLLAALIGVPLGLVSGYFGRRLDQAVALLVDIQLSFPFLLVALIFVAVFGPSLVNLGLVLGLAGWASYSRMTRGYVLALRPREFIVAATAIGCSDARIILRHVLPNVLPALIVVSTLNLARFMLAETALSYLGLGAPPPTPSWGLMISEARAYTFTAPWIQVFPGVAIVMVVGGFGLLSDWLRSAISPELKV